MPTRRSPARVTGANPEPLFKPLPHVEDGTLTLIGATTENPYSVTDAVKAHVG